VLIPGNAAQLTLDDGLALELGDVLCEGETLGD